MEKPKILWVNASILLTTPPAAAILIPLYAWYVGFDLFEWVAFAIAMFITGISITAGYHRLWTHKAYEAKAPWRLFLALGGAASLQNSILHWASDHRRHHRFVDNDDKDPYSAGKGFWYSHMGWILRDYKVGIDDFSNVEDLQKDPIVAWQHRYYIYLAVGLNTILPLAIGLLHGKLFGVFLLAGLLRIVLNHHFTFFINSLAHIWGKQPYTEKNSARDNHVLAVFTYGEGYHNFHHRFSADYRNGIRWWHYDPAKWIIRALSLVGVTRNLNIVPSQAIAQAVQQETEAPQSVASVSVAS